MEITDGNKTPDTPQKFSVKRLFYGRLDSTNYFFAVLLNLPINFMGKYDVPVIDRHPVIFLIFFIPILLIFISASVRRFHDLRRSGWWTLLLFVPGLGALLSFVLFLKKGEHVSNKYGPVPDPNKHYLSAIFNL